MNVRRLADSATAVWNPLDGLESARFPASIPVTPPWPSTCSAEPMRTPPEVWSEAGWDALYFVPYGDTHHYRYAFTSSGEGLSATFTASAFGDLDGDCVYSTFTRTGWIDPEAWGGPMPTMDPPQVFHELE